MGMGKDFYETFDNVKEIFDSACEWLDLDIKALCFEENDKLDLTEYSQPALVTTCLAMADVLRNKGIEPDISAGLSLGEYCAIATAGAISVKDAITDCKKTRNPYGAGSSGGARSNGSGSWYDSGRN